MGRKKTDLSALEPSELIKILSNKLEIDRRKSKKFYDTNVKNNPEAMEKHKEKCKEAQRRYIAKLKADPETREQYNEKCREQQKLHFLKKKNLALESVC